MPFPTPPIDDEDDMAVYFGDDVFCSACGGLITDGGGLYCSSFCESLGNPDSEGL